MHDFARPRVLDYQKVGVEGLAGERGQRRLGLRAQMDGLGLEVRSVDGITEQRVTGVREMDPDLVRAPGLQPQGE